MNLTSKSRYGIKVMIDLARHNDRELVKRHDIALRQGIPAKYLDQILVRLRKSGLVDSIRGRCGGYKIGRDAQSISLWDVFYAVEDGLYPVECVDENQSCNHASSCVASEPWKLIFEGLKASLEGTSLWQLEQEFARDEKMCPMAGVRECRPGRVPSRISD